jgi:hypothetical protein
MSITCNLTGIELRTGCYTPKVPKNKYEYKSLKLSAYGTELIDKIPHRY